uniref:TRAF3-interacting protein 1 n=1 Tax=Seriola lalandi dorsalis TaxID=1841481 RepID=A0A3B4YD06_SERLL
MNAALVRKTQDTLGKVIKKPPLTEKLLSKPPFRYLHDIFSEVIRTTGFMKGLYGENEMKSDNVKDKDSKIVFLQKAIDVVMLVSGEPLAAKPARIVAGHEPEKTNELLQAIAKCCLNKLSSEDAVKRVLAGEKVDMKTKASTSRSQDKENREGRELALLVYKQICLNYEFFSMWLWLALKRSGSRDQKDPDQPKEQESRRRDGEKEHHRDRERSDKHHRSEQDRGKDRDKDKSRDRERDKDRDKGRVKDRDKVKDRERDREREKEREKTRERDSHREGERDKEKRRERDKEREKERERHKEGDERNKSVENGSSKVQLLKPTHILHIHIDNKIVSEEPQQKPSPEEPSKTAKPVPAVSSFGQKYTLFNITLILSSFDFLICSYSMVRIARPGSARPAPPRVKRQESYTDVNSAESRSFTSPLAVSLTLGGLVKKILETKKDYELSPSSSKSKDQNLVSEAAQKKEQDMVTREIERLRSSIQTVCRSSLPLGKIMDYIQEDMDAMQAELHTWRRENKEHAQALLQEQRSTDRAVEPLKVELAELEQLIKDQQDKICAVRSNILKNEEKIQKMVTGINFSSRT